MSSLQIEETPHTDFEHVFYPKPADFVPREVFPPGHKWASQRECQAWSSRHGRQCESHPRKGKTKCRVHGGNSPSGIASPSYRTGKYSNSLPARLVARYQQSALDPDLLALRDEIAVVDARISDLLARVDTGETGELWYILSGVYADYEAAYRAKDIKKMGEAIAQWGDIVKRGRTDAGAWAEIGAQFELRRRLVESERKRLLDMQAMINAEQAMSLIAAIAATIRANVTDKTALDNISRELVRLANFEPGGSAITGE